MTYRISTRVEGHIEATIEAANEKEAQQEILQLWQSRRIQTMGLAPVWKEAKFVKLAGDE